MTSLQDKAAMDAFLLKFKNGCLVEFYGAGEEAVPEDLQEAAALLAKADPFIAVARVKASEKLGKKYDPVDMSLPTLKFFYKSKESGEEFDGERGEAELIAAYAKEQSESATPPEIEEMKSSRGDRLCFKAEGLCAIYLTSGAELSKDELGMLTRLKHRFTSKLSSGTNARGATLNWSWLDGSVQDGFKALLKGEELPNFVIYNPHKRPRYQALEEDVSATEDAMQNLIDKVLGGDARFTAAKGQKLPVFAGKEKGADGEL